MDKDPWDEGSIGTIETLIQEGRHSQGILSAYEDATDAHYPQFNDFDGDALLSKFADLVIAKCEEFFPEDMWSQRFALAVILDAMDEPGLEVRVLDRLQDEIAPAKRSPTVTFSSSSSSSSSARASGTTRRRGNQLFPPLSEYDPFQRIQERIDDQEGGDMIKLDETETIARLIFLAARGSDDGIYLLLNFFKDPAPIKETRGPIPKKSPSPIYASIEYNLDQLRTLRPTGM